MQFNLFFVMYENIFQYEFEMYHNTFLRFKEQYKSIVLGCIIY
jgi:hypothetical protein